MVLYLSVQIVEFMSKIFRIRYIFDDPFIRDAFYAHTLPTAIGKTGDSEPHFVSELLKITR